MIPFHIILYVEEHTLKCGGIEWWDFRLHTFFLKIHVFPLTVNTYHFWSKKDKSSIFPYLFLFTVCTVLNAGNHPFSCGNGPTVDVTFSMKSFPGCSVEINLSIRLPIFLIRYFDELELLMCMCVCPPLPSILTHLTNLSSGRHAGLSLIQWDYLHLVNSVMLNLLCLQHCSFMSIRGRRNRYKFQVTVSRVILKFWAQWYIYIHQMNTVS